MGDMVGWVIGILSIAIAIITYYKSNKHAIPSIMYRSEVVIDKTNKIGINSLEVKYNDVELDRLVRTYIFFWNCGNKTLNGADISSTDKLRIEMENDTILNARIIKTSRKANRFQIKQDKAMGATVNIDFEFLDPKDGATLEILHIDKINPRIEGTIKGIPSGVKEKGVYHSKLHNSLPIFIVLIVELLLSIIGLVLSVIGFIFNNRDIADILFFPQLTSRQMCFCGIILCTLVIVLCTKAFLKLHVIDTIPSSILLEDCQLSEELQNQS